MSEFIETFILIFGILGLGTTNMVQGFSPRIAHFVLPIAGKRNSDWAYSWIPVLAPICGGIVAALTFSILF